MVKRKRTSSGKTYRSSKRRRTVGPRRAYKNSLVPLASRGYQINRAERKVWDIASGTVQVNTTGAVSNLFAPQKGTDFQERIGRKTVLKSIFIRGTISTEIARTTNTDAAVEFQYCRMLIGIDYQPNGAVPTIDEIFAVNNDPLSHLDLNQRDRFRIIWDKHWVFDPYKFNKTATQSYASTTNQVKCFKYYKKLNLETIFNAGNAGTVADISSGALWMCWIGSGVAGTNSDCNAVITTRCRFVDA